jgi:hypothetical protein
MRAKSIAVAALSAVLASCSDPVAPEPQPSVFSFDMSVAGSVTASFSGLIGVLTIDDGMARGTTPSGPLTFTDMTTFGLIPEGETVGLAVALFGPFEAGTYQMLRDDEALDPNAKRFEVYYTARTGTNSFHVFKVNSGSVTVAGTGADRRVVDFSFAADSAEVIERGGFSGMVSAPVQISAALRERQR